MLAALYMALSSVMFASMGACLKLVSDELDTAMLVFLRSLFGLLFLLPVLFWKKGLSLKTSRPAAHLFRTLAGLAAMYLFFYAISHVSLAVAVLLSYTTPLFAPLIARIWLGERAGWQLIAIIGLGFVGVLLILKPGSDMFAPAALVALGSGFMAALAAVMIRKMKHTEPSERIVWYYTLGCTLFSAIPLIWIGYLPSFQATGWMALAGLFATFGQLFLSQAYTRGRLAEVGPFVYLNVVVATCYGWFFWQELPDYSSFAGIFVVVLAGIITLRLLGKQDKTTI